MTEQPPLSHYLPDVESSAETARLQAQGRLLTLYGGGILPEFPLERFHNVLDIACGPGDWVLEYAFQSPESKVTGIDISKKMIGNAQAQAQAQGLENAQFHLMDATRPLAFPDASFDLINVRAIGGMMPAALWPQFLQECKRLARPGGLLRLTETDNWGLTSSSAFETLNRCIHEAVKRAGMGFSPDGSTIGITNRLQGFLKSLGCQHVGARSFHINFSCGTEGHTPWFRNYEAAFLNVKESLLKWEVIKKEEFEQLFQQAMHEMRDNPDFYGIAYFLTAWGEIPS
jgi:ubiquinone/menaquinone biosynthesis C-methylase UbiE